MEKPELKRTILEYIDKHQRDILDYLGRLISFNSPPGSELEVQNFLREDLVRSMGFDQVDFFAVDKENKRPNNVGIKKGVGDGRDIIINGHIDISPVSDEAAKKWTNDPWKSTVNDGKIYGRGASDMKGGLTAAIWAVKTLTENNIRLKGNVYLEVVVGEEGAPSEPELGTLAVCRRGYSAPIAIVTEPTDCEIFVDQSGVIGWDIDLPGKAIHVGNRNLSAYPQRTGLPMGSGSGVNAFLKAMKIVNALEELERQWVLRPRKGAWGSGGIPNPDKQGIGMWNNVIVAVQAGDFNIWALAGHCRIRGLTFYPPWVKEKDVIDEIWKTIESVGATDDWIREKIRERTLVFNPRVLAYWGPTSVPLGHELVTILHDSFRHATGKETTISGAKFVSDATHLDSQGIPTIIFGPGDINYGAHASDEFVPVDELINCTKTLALGLVDWCQTA
jgi:acetylornithine deacetylase/succinyl-diaminopimelate desuccinylase-like protein